MLLLRIETYNTCSSQLECNNLLTWKVLVFDFFLRNFWILGFVCIYALGLWLNYMFPVPLNSSVDTFP